MIEHCQAVALKSPSWRRFFARQPDSGTAAVRVGDLGRVKGFSGEWVLDGNLAPAGGFV